MLHKSKKTKKQIHVFLVTTADKFELPLGCFDSIKQVSRFLNALPDTCYHAIQKNAIVQKKYLIFKVKI